MSGRFLISAVFVAYCFHCINTEDINDIKVVEAKGIEISLKNKTELKLRVTENSLGAEDCKCTNGTCVKINGKLECTCPPEYGVYRQGTGVFGGKIECRACKCGKDSNCTIDVSFWSTTINCICKAGYKVVNNFCQGPCTENPCKNGGICTDNNTSFKCICPTGYSEKLCELDSCFSNPCLNGGECKASGTTFTCKCKNLFNGEYCEIGPCSSNPCLNNGECKVSETSFTCNCKSPFNGKLCEIDPCSSNPCKNGGECNISGTDFTCKCEPPFKGKQCEIGACYSNPCKNGGECKDSGTSFACKCKTPFNGKYCEIDPCSSNPCKNGGECKVLGTSFSCKCKSPFSGELCDIGPCSSNPCKNGGECNVSGTDFICKCKPPFSGKQCEIGPCSSNPCQNGGECKDSGTSFTCKCKTPFNGKYCEIDPCSSKPCKNNGICHADDENYYCYCRMPFYGPTCEEIYITTESTPSTEYTTLLDESDGTSTETNPTEFLTTEEVTSEENCYCGINSLGCFLYRGKKLCTCKENYAQRNGTCKKTCHFNSECLNRGLCKMDRGNYFCECPDLYLGDRCEIDLCKHINRSCHAIGGVCKRQGDIGVCQCPDGKAWSSSSRRCEDCYCGINSQNCFLYREKKLCNCKENYAERNGSCIKTCRFDSECLNRGLCKMDRGNYFCECPDVYLGDRCEIDLCKHINRSCHAIGGVCKRQGDIGVCQCPEGKAWSVLSGMCEDVCNSDTCVHGHCKTIERIYKCVCNHGFTGRHCDKKISQTTDALAILVLILFIGIVIFAVAAIIAICWVKRLQGKLMKI